MRATATRCRRSSPAKWALRRDDAAAGSGLRRAFPAARPRAAASARGSRARRWRRRWKRSRPRAARRSTAANWPRRWSRMRRRTARAHTLADFADHTLDWVTPLALDYGGATVHEIPPNGQGIAAQMALGILAHLRPRRAAARFGREPAPADRGDEARVRRRPSLRQRSAHDGGHAGGAARPALSRGARAADRSEARAGFRPRQAAAGRHRLSVRRRRGRHDGVADPVELHGLRLRRRRARHRHQPAEPRRRILAASRDIRTRSAAASGRSTRSSRAFSRRTARRSRRSA